MTPRMLALAMFAALPAAAQLAPPNAAGVRFGHVHLLVKNIDAQKHFWIEVMGGKPVKNQQLEMIEFPGVYIMLRQGDPSGPPAGAIVDHFGFVLRDLPAAIARWNAEHLKVEQTGTNPNQRYVTAPDGIRVEAFGDPKLPVPIQMNHVHFYPLQAEVAAMKAWYAQTFGGVPGTRESVARPGNFMDTDDLPGNMNLSIGVSDTRRAPTAGRSIDHIGFEVANLAEFVAKLQGQGQKFDEAPRASNGSAAVRVAYLTDPWGTKIEVTQGLGAEPSPSLR